MQNQLKPSYLNLSEKAKEVRRNIINLAFSRKEGHIGGGLSIVDVLVSLYYHIMKEDDKFILSKGHAYLPLFIILRDKGFNPEISGHPEIDLKNGIECTTGSLGHGLPIACGIALAKKINNSNGKTYVIISDAECQEGTTWESGLIATQHKLNNLVVIIDNNKLQTLGKTEDILNVENLEEKFKAFGWVTRKINGHSFEEIIYTLEENNKENKPLVIIAETIKGKGVSYMENVSKWHTTIPNDEELKQALIELQ